MPEGLRWEQGVLEEWWAESVLREKEEQHKVSGRSGWGQIKAYGHGRNLSLFPTKSGVSEGF